MTGMDILLASLTQEQLNERAMDDVRSTMAELIRWEAEYWRLIAEDLEKRIGE